MKYKNILWDWNGTLMDDLQAAFDSVNIMLESRDMAPIDLNTYYSYITTPISGFYEKCFDMSKEKEELIYPEYQRIYDEHTKNHPLDSTAMDVVSELERRGVRQFVVSACEETSLIEWLERYDIKRFMEHITGSDSLKGGSKITRGKELMKKYGLDPAETLFAGDTLHDLDTANALGIDCVLLLSGHQKPQILERKTECITANGLKDVIDLF